MPRNLLHKQGSKPLECLVFHKDYHEKMNLLPPYIATENKKNMDIRGKLEQSSYLNHSYA